MIKTIGLTGSIATGKSTASKYLQELGCALIDGDVIAREVAEDPRVLEAIRVAFGGEVLDDEGKLRRKKLGALVFNDDKALKKLNEIMHPAIRSKIKDQLQTLKDRSQNRTPNRSQVEKAFDCVVIDGALLIEMKLHSWVDEVWVVAITKEEQIRRLMERDGISKTDARKRIEAQMSTEEKEKFADVVLDNSKDPEYLREQIELEFFRLKNKG